MTRPSTSRAVIVSSVTSTCSIRDSTLTAVFIPGLDDDCLVRDDQPTNVVEFPSAESMIPRERDWRQPEFAVLTVTPNVHVHRLVAIETIEEEPVRSSDAGDSRHSIPLH